MTTIAQLAAYLATLPQDAEVMVLQTVSKNWEVWAEWQHLELGDCTDNMHMNSDNTILYLGDD